MGRKLLQITKGPPENLVEFSENKLFAKSLFTLVFPIVIQNFISALVSSADIFILGAIGQRAISAVSLAAQYHFVFNLFIAGLTIGVSMLASQYWGKKDTAAIEKILGIGVRLSFFIAIIFFFGSLFFSKALMLVFTSDPELIETGSEYLMAVSPSYLFMGIAQIYLCILRSTERVKIGTLINSAALILNVCLNTLVVFGFFGFPKLGVRGVAWATSAAWGIDMIWCIAESARNKTVRLRPSAVFRRSGILFNDFMHYSLPVLANELVWGTGFTMYSVIMGHMGSDMAAANSVSTAVRNLAIAASLAVASGGGILLGKEMGQQQMEKAKKDAARLCKTALVCGIHCCPV
jgi:putative MATE family efflux protein